MSTEREGYHGPSTFEGKSQVDPNTRPAWFTEVIDSIPDVGRRLLEDYSGIAPEQVLPHVIHVVSTLLPHLDDDFKCSNLELSETKRSISGHTDASAKSGSLTSLYQNYHTGPKFLCDSAQVRPLSMLAVALARRSVS